MYYLYSELGNFYAQALFLYFVCVHTYKAHKLMNMYCTKHVILVLLLIEVSIIFCCGLSSNDG